MATPLRDYQERTLRDCRAAYREGKRSIVIVSPTGSGKTRMGVELATNHLARVPTGRALWLAHRRELVRQAADRLYLEGVDSIRVEQAGIEAGATDSRVVVASVETLVARPDLQLPGVSMVILDECHHYVSREWHSVVQRWPDAVRLGLTATPCRADGTGLGGLFNGIVIGATVRELTERGHLVPCDVLAPAKFQSALAQSPVDAWREHGRGARAVVFCADVGHAQRVADEFVAAGVCAANIDGETPAHARWNALAAFRTGQIRILTNVFVLTEGWDCPEAEVCIIARGCSHVGTFLQMVGRVLRPAQGKDRATLIDLRGVVRVHGMPADDREFSLEGKPIRKLATLPPLRQCPKCGAVYRAGPDACVRCGARMPKPKPPRVNRQKLGLVTHVATADQKRATFEYLKKLAQSKGYKPGWAAVQYKARYGHWPARSP